MRFRRFRLPPAACLLLTVAVAAASAATPDYPCWRGRDGSGDIESGNALVRSWDDARLLWVSEDNPLPPEKSQIVLRPRQVCGNGGFGCPVVADGRVYVAAYRPSGPLAEILWAKARESSPDYIRRVAADELLYCLDAETGRTLWVTAYEMMGLNRSAYEHTGHYVPCVADGRVYWVGTLGRLFCVDAASGKKLWDRSTGPASDEAYLYLEYCLKVKKLGGQGPRDRSFRECLAQRDRDPSPEDYKGSRNWGWDSIPQVAEGVVAVNTNNRGAVAFDAVTGRELWRKRNCTNTTRPLLVWRHGRKAYFIAVGGTLQCIEPRSGEVLWSAGGVGTPGYSGHTPAIAGDRLVALSEETDPAVDGSWGCWKLTPTGAERLWTMPTLWRYSYGSPLIHRDRLWLEVKEFRRFSDSRLDVLQDEYPDLFGPKEMLALRDARHLFVGVDMATGKVTGAIPFGGMGCGSPVAMDGRILLPEANGLGLIDASSGAPERLGWIGPGHIVCVTPTVADGRVYHRGAKHLVHCWDLRKASARTPRAAPASATPPSPGDGLLVVDLEGLRLNDPDLDMAWRGGPRASCEVSGTDLRWHLRTEGGRVVQSWVTCPPHHQIPEWSMPGRLHLTKEGVKGDARLYVMGRNYPIDVDLAFDGGRVTGTWRDTATAQPKRGQVRGLMSPTAAANGTVELQIRREWCGGQARRHHTTLTFDLVDGRGVNPRLLCAQVEDGWTAEVTEFDVKLEDGHLGGQFTAELDSNTVVPSGTYQLLFDTPVVCNKPAGEYSSYRGSEEITPDSAVNRRIWGRIELPEKAEADPANAIYDVDLAGALPDGKALRLAITLAGGKAVAVKTTTPTYGRGDHVTDVSGLRLEGDRLAGPIEVIIRADGYNPTHDHRCRYDLDLRLKDRDVTGTFTGEYDVRRPRTGKARGLVTRAGRPASAPVMASAAP